MTNNLSFDEQLALVESRSAALRGAVAGAGDLGALVPSCPDWALRDLVTHLGQVHRSWTATVLAGPADKPPSETSIEGVTPRGDLLEWSAESTRLLLTALRDAGPDRECWTWWGSSGAPMTSGAVARHQVQEAAVHAYDGQLAVGGPEAVPFPAAADGIAEFVEVGLGSEGPWPHPAARVGLRAAEGPSWVIELTPSGAAFAAPGGTDPAVVLHGPASDLVLWLHRRVPLDQVRIEGDRDLAERLLAWPSLD